jgi:hypothetical protein
MKYLFLDDIRMPGDVTWICIGTSKAYHDSRGTPWNIVRSFNEAVEWVNTNGFPDLVSFDHDLGYEEFNTTESGMVVVTNATEEKSGHDFAKWLVEHDIETNTMPDNFAFTVHSKNPVGAKNIQMLLDNYIQHKRNK